MTKGIINTIQQIKLQKKSDATDRLQLPMRDSSKIASDIPKNISPIDNSNITYSSQNVNLSSINNMPKNEIIILSEEDTKDIYGGCSILKFYYFIQYFKRRQINY